MRLKATKVKTAKNRSLSSSLWLQRQLNDEYVVLSKKDGYRSRAAYKLIEIDEKFRIFKPNMKVVDLGAAPGGWSQVLSSKIGKKGKIIALDLIDIPSIDKVEFFQGDFRDQENIDKILEIMDGKLDLILSDMAPNTTGHKHTDHLKIIDLCERVFEFADKSLNINGTVVVKLFQGGTQSELLSDIKKKFTSIKHFKPESSRKESSEIYLIASGYKKNDE